jgi:transketolase
MDSMRDRFVSVVTELLESEPRLAVVLADITVDRFKATGALQRHPDRVVNVGIREQLMVDVAAGMALGGMRTIAHSFAPFLVERGLRAGEARILAPGRRRRARELRRLLRRRRLRPDT